MELISLNADLRKIQPGKPPLLEQTLNAMISLCIDIQAYCKSDITEGSVEDYMDLNNNLTFLSEMLCGIYDAKREKIQMCGEDTFPEKLRTVEKETREIKQRLAAAREQMRDFDRLEQERKNLLEQEKSNLEQTRQKESRNEKLRGELEKTISQIQDIDLPRLVQKNSDLEGRKNQLEGEKSSLEEANRGLEAQETELARQVKEARAKEKELRNLSGSHESVLKELADIPGKITGIKAALEEDGKKLEDLRREHEQIKTRQRNLREDIRRAEEEKTTLDREANDLSEMFRAADTARQNAQTKRDGMDSSVKRAVKEEEDLKKETGVLKERQAQIQRRIEEAEQEKSNLMGQIRVQQETLAHRDLANEQFRDGPLKIAQDDLKKAEEHGKKLTGERDRLSEQLKEKKRKNDQIDGEIIQFGKLIEEDSKKLERREKELNALKKRYDQKKEELDKLNRNASSLDEGLERLIEEVAAKQEKLKEKNYDGLKEEQRKIIDELDQKNAEIPAMKERISVEKKKLETVRNEYEQIQSDESTTLLDLAFYEQKLRELRDRKVVEKTKKLNERLEILKQIRSEILAAADGLKPNDPNDVSAALRMKLTDIEDTLTGLSECMERYATALDQAIE